MNPAWIAPAAAEAKRLGLHIHGHVPATVRSSEAVAAGYDELTHLNFVVVKRCPRTSSTAQTRGSGWKARPNISRTSTSTRR